MLLAFLTSKTLNQDSTPAIRKEGIHSSFRSRDHMQICTAEMHRSQTLRFRNISNNPNSHRRPFKVKTQHIQTTSFFSRV